MQKRNYYFDNAKFILIFFVVFGHLLQSFIADNEIIHALYKAIYTFHMPAFILVSGFFAKGFYQKGYLRKITKKLILPYLIFQLIYSVYYYYLYGQSQLTVDPLDPHWSLWFLVSLFFWNIMLLGFSKLKAVTAISISLVIALAIGYIDFISNYLSLSRTFVFFPLFLLGYYLKKEHLSSLFNVKARSVAALAFVIVFAWFYLNPDINYQWLLGSKPYGEMGAASLAAMGKRLGFYLLSLMMVFSFFAFVPKKQYFFTDLGKNTLYVYLLHGFFVKTFRESPVQDYFTGPESYLLLAVVSLLLTLLLSSKIATSFAQPFIELKLSKFKRLSFKVFSALKFYKKKLQNG
ncbi:acyltransferase [Bacillus sp. V3-13]|uniref:acyltransferase family protein n=1 Tax=Bacillus sp. V3-13 TaxID=2053728 RepID=UPI000C77CF4A|nr:acyltransferase family protein [Bacillus sp. V3-13]PLR76107.1 acyltransferase [Bacillus sp. V3-13]